MKLIRIAYVAILFLTVSSKSFGATPQEMTPIKRDVSVKVVQNRYFIKSLRPEIAIIGGRFLNEAYTLTVNRGLRLSFFPTESIGFELQHFRTVIDDTEDLKSLKKLAFREINSEKLVYPNPEVNRINDVSDFNVVGIPFYGKLNLFDFAIVYSDLHVSAGYSQINTDQGSIKGVNISAGQRFFIGTKGALSFDFRDHIFDETRNNKNTVRNALSINLGASYFIF
jgi:outer membrane beta-barrel protein